MFYSYETAELNILTFLANIFAKLKPFLRGFIVSIIVSDELQ